MKIGIYNPYSDSLGGGERYVFTLAAHWSKVHGVDVFWDNEQILLEAQNRFDLDLSAVHVVPNIFRGRNLLKKLSATYGYDCMFFLSDGSVPTSLARHNILHFQVPFRHVSFPSWKAQRYQRIICNSAFTQKYLDTTVRIKRDVIYPPVDTKKIKAGKKINTILSVGRFSSLYTAKKQHVLIDIFKKAYSAKQLSGWELVLAGGLMKSDEKYFNELKKEANGFPIQFRPNCSFPELTSLYAEASLYWHAAGFGEDKPENMEHFGITTVEAMAAKCVPVVFDGGGQGEIVQDGKSGMLWKTTEELIEKTLVIIKDKNLFSELQDHAIKRAEEFSQEKFTEAFDQLLLEL